MESENKMNYQQIQQELQNGTSISDVCTKHKITFQTLITNLSKPQKTPAKKKRYKRKHKHPNHNISTHKLRNGKTRYILQKTVNGKNRVFGSYITLKDARTIRDHMDKYGWNINLLDTYCETCNVTRCKGRWK